ncbi:MAG: hypothetical protein M1839_008425 [Geoglossum umbratile]|nr:MAG: hypothetical protein M1839_008425 [Geoglossum umbratile]
MSEPSKACCTIPPIVASGYVPKGQYQTISGLKTYCTSAANPRGSILFIFDIFGYFPQTLQGADILAHSGNMAVYMPDWFDDQPADLSWYPADNAEKGAALKRFFAEKGDLSSTVARAQEWRRGAPTASNGSWGVVGLCWGGKVAALLAGPGTEFACAAMAHPAMVEPADAEAVQVPFAVLASRDEDAEVVRRFGEALKGRKIVETFADQVHGWMGARGDLGEERCKEEFERGYRILVEFFGENLV